MLHINVWVFLTLLYFQNGSAARTNNACEKGSCLPGTGNLLIGRENRLRASSTCGLQGREKFCVVTSLEEAKKCFWCDSAPKITDYRFNHRIEHVVSKIFPSSRKQSWWQSQNGVENVTIQLDLEAEFYFTYLYMRFKTFRPAALLVERSYDSGTTWQVYRYFASDCSKLFPNVPKGQQHNLTIAYCDEHYSSVTPTSNGDVILKILPPTLENIDPYSDDIKSLVKVTNLRINFTKLHTLGDDLLDNREDLRDKYYYAISEMVVGGSCSCHGHANRCIPQEGVDSKPNMVHGKCECTHHTKGLNCEKCEDLYWDLDWHPAVGKETNACKKCNCNNHATSCHFDERVFNDTGKQSGGVCDNCLHNTFGTNCEQCKHFYYHDTSRDFADPEACIPCNCNKAGTVDGGICDSRTDDVNNLVSGRCHCKENVQGRDCDSCKDGFWNFDEANPLGCQSCSCNIKGTHDNKGCHKETGECTCKTNVIGRDCNQCKLEFWGLGDSAEGCQRCECNPGGSYDNYCDVITGQCKCRPNITGRTCNAPEQTYFIKSLDFMVYEAEIASNCYGAGCKQETRAPYPTGVDTTWTGPGFMRVYPNSVLEFPIDNVNTELDYEIVIRYEAQVPNTWDRVRVTLIRPDTPGGNCSEKIGSGDVRDTYLTAGSIQVSVNPPFCLEEGKNYTVRLEFIPIRPEQNVPTASILIDSVVLVPHIESVPFMHGSQIAHRHYDDFYRNRCEDSIYSVVKSNLSEVCRAYHYSIGTYVHGGGYPCKCDSTGSHSLICDSVGGHCSCKPNVVGRQCNRCATGTYGFGPEGCKDCDCHSVGALDNFCDVYSGQCKCRPLAYGRSCDQCQPGSWNYPDCQRCICHGHADTCEARTGVCNACKNHTEGNHCDRCIEGFYGDPRIGVDIPCRMCPCPGTVEQGHSFARRCALDSRNQDVICECDIGYAGLKCERCAENYYGNPEVPGGRCTQCNCSNNVDIARPGNCDLSTGKCLQCLYNTEGFHCEHCRSGFFGDALQQMCMECVCDILGTDSKSGPCDRVTGQCPCLANVTGLRCNECMPNHWKIASGHGCEPCACDPMGSESDQCNQFDGQCKCKKGFGGRQCNQCQANYWGNPNEHCYSCECNPDGAASMQCNQTTGDCVCMLGIGGKKCDQCARGYLGQMPRCTPCGECFDNWDVILKDLEEQTKAVTDKAGEIMKTGATGSFTKEFETMEKKLMNVKHMLQNTTASSQQLQDLDKLIAKMKVAVTSSELMNNVSAQAENVTQRITLLLLKLSDLKKRAESLNESMENLKDNTTKLQEENVEGALNLTKEAYSKALLLQRKNKETENTIAEADRSCKKTEALMTKHQNKYTSSLEQDDKTLSELTKYVSDLEAEIPSLNRQVCDKGGNPCDDLCGGAGCGFCGGLSCEDGALTKSDNALKFAKDASKSVQEKQKKTTELMNLINQAQSEAENALNITQKAFLRAEQAKLYSDLTLNKTERVINELQKFINNSGTEPSAIRKLAEETLKKTIKLEPEKITELAHKINNTVASLKDIDTIIAATAGDLQDAKHRKQVAEQTKNRANEVLKVTEKVVSILDEAEKSQNSAEIAINTADKNITLARKDLAMISERSAKAQQDINGTATEFKNLEDDFKKLQTKFLKNNADAQKVEEELKIVVSDVEETQRKTLDLTLNYQSTAAELEKKASNLTDAHKKAQDLFERAAQLQSNTMKKHQELTDAAKQLTEQDKDMEAITNKIKELMLRMQTNFDEIKNKAESYHNCQ